METLSIIQSGPNFAQSSHLALTESINEKDVILFLCEFTLSDKGKRRFKPELQQCLKLTGTSGCLHMSRVRPDLFWVSDNRSNLILFNKEGDIQQHVKNEILPHI